MLSSSSNSNNNNSLEEEQELASLATPTYNDQLSSYREKHRVYKEKKKNQDMASLTAFLIASKYDPQTSLTSSGLERYTPKATGFCGNTPTNATRSKVSFRASNVRGRGLPTVQPGSWFKPSIQQEHHVDEQQELAKDESATVVEASLSNLSLKEEVVVSSSSSSLNVVPVRRL
ncbi:hypothetical protein NAEGRDRAFT_57298 [Naegleria gruberi]|uniref:Uncharacterized protein n=1 Tax=Naegleria gruberi TaxID=5762 RepID=D2V6K8_NAEGR|nr:uncharacterized protein NAEGRDRAFT_57298 [Naegleria gruberi]EFC47458.1 hypothetical protein NAEGRDRAFT_57298 [Naegleria gruberi]|eukprot:XP_002680202.1 hypothetical protein NAEGRDRAFT_57298 [Naegleria gruberi strain NEG-M]